MRRALLLTLIVLAGCADDGGGTDTFDEPSFDITFEYPGEMKEAENVSLSSGAGNAAKATEGIGFGKRDVIIVQRYDLSRSVEDADEVRGEFDRLVKQISPTTAAGSTGTTSGFPSIEYRDLEIEGVEGAESRLVALFDGDVEYLFNCQSTPDRRKDIDEACEQALKTVKKK